MMGGGGATFVGSTESTVLTWKVQWVEMLSEWLGASVCRLGGRVSLGVQEFKVEDWLRTLGE